MSSPSTSAVLLTGCSSGIGRASALAFHAAGHPVYATARRPESIADLASRGIVTFALDVTDDASMHAAVARVEGDHGAVGVLVNNAGYALQGPVEEASMADVRRQFDTNVFGLVRLCQLVLPGMRRAGRGRLVNVGSMGGRFTFPGGGFYHASKHAVEAISDALRYEVTPFGVRVVLVQPGPVQTAFADTAVATIQDPAEESGPYAGFRRALGVRYAKAYEGSRTSMIVPPERVAATILRAATRAHPRPRYAVGTVARAMITARRLSPDIVFDRLIRHSFPTPTGGRS